MKLYDYYRSSASFRVRIALNLKKLPYEITHVHLIEQKGEHHHKDYIDINPQALVPSLQIDGQVLTQSLAIIEFLEEVYPTPPLLPQSPILRANARSMAQMIACDIHPLNNLRVLNQLRVQFSSDDKAIQCWYHHWLREGFNAIEVMLKKRVVKFPFCFSEIPGLAEICIIPQVYNAHRFSFDMSEYPRMNKIYTESLKETAFQNATPENHPFQINQ